MKITKFSTTSPSSHKPLVYFGQSQETFDDLTVKFPNLKFAKLKQVHGVNVVESSIATSDSIVPPEADGHWTTTPNLAICIQTADCLPILAHHPGLKKIWALHAGWRGVVANIVKATFEGIPNPNEIKIWIGPHIQQKSFTVRSDIVDNFAPKFVTPKDNESFHVDLTAMALEQLSEYGITDISISHIDTYTDLNYHSFRREKTKGRQWSLITL